MMVLWLRFLTEINSNTKEIPADLLNDPEIGKAVEDLEVSGFTDAELRAYDKFWNSVSVERTLMDDRYQKGIEKGKEEGIAEGMEMGMKQGMEKGRAEGMEKGMSQRSLEIARKMLAKGLYATCHRGIYTLVVSREVRVTMFTGHLILLPSLGVY